MNQQELEKWIADNGGAGAVQFTTKTVTVKNPAKSLTLADGTDNPDYNPDAAIPATITLQVLNWVNPKTGAAISVRPSAAGQYEVVEQAGAKPPDRADVKPEDPPQEKDDQGRHYIWEPNPDGRGGAWKDVGPAAQKPATPPQERVDPANPKRRQRWDPSANGGAGDWVDAGEIAQKPSGLPQERVNPEDPTRRQRWDQDTGAWVDAGAIAKPPEKPDVRSDGKGGFVRVNPDGTLTPVTPQDGTDPTFTGTPPPWVPKAVQDDLTAYSKQLQEAVASGAITPQRASQLMEARYKSAQAAVDNQLAASKTIYDAGVNERTQDVNLANTRLNASHQGIASGLDFFKNVNSRLKEGSTAGADAFLAIRNMAYQDAQKYGGLDQIPHTPIPAALQSAANSITITSPDGTTVTVPHGAGAAAPSPAAPAVPAMPQPSPDLPAPQPSLAQAPQPTGFAAIDQYSQQIDSGLPTTVTAMEDALRRNGIEEDAISASRRNLLGAA